MESAVNHHVATANHTRTVDINVESTSTSITEREDTVVRQLENINKSRVLNLVFRQLQQEFITLTYLNDVSIIFTNGYPEQQRMTNLQGLDMFLMDVFENDDTKIGEFKHTLFTYLCSIYDYTGTKVGFIEQISEDLSNCIDPTAPSETVRYVRKRKSLQQTYHGKTVNGIILSAVSRITNTPGVIVDALLGQGEALDCYNMRLQDAAAINANLQNEKLAKEIPLIDEQKAKLQAENEALLLQNQKLTQAMALIDAISDPLEKANAYKKVFTECCGTPQSGCGCGNCQGNAPS